MTTPRPGRRREGGEEAARLLAPALVCAHCGLDVPAALVRAGDDRQFCCAGCRQVYTLVHEWGFDQYYRLVGQQPGGLEPARVTGRGFEDFDDERLQAEATDEAGPERRRTRLYLEGVHCSACVWLVEKLPAVLSGVDEVRLNYGSAVAEVTWRPARTRLSMVARALDRLGYTPHIHRASRVQEARRSEDRATLARFGVAIACDMNLMFLQGALYAGEYSGMAPRYWAFLRWLSFAASIPAMVYSARPFFQTAIAGLRTRTVHIDLPIAAALGVAFAASVVNTVRGAGPIWFDSVAMLIAALLGARQLQRSAQRAAIERADSLRGAAFLEFARRLEGDGVDAPSVEVPLTGLVAGDRVEVRSGEVVPVDGVVLAGRSSLDNAVLTGESTPLAVREGDPVNAGATNVGARLVVRVDAAGDKTRVGSLLAIVQEALARRPELLETTDGLARRFVQVLMACALATGVFWTARAGFGIALERIVALLVVACPCALGLSVPLAVSVALTRAARAGLFVKNPDALQQLCRPGTVLLDKTGTLTDGQVTVARWHGADAAFDLAQALEAQSAHAVARAFQRSLGRPMRLVRSVADVVEVPGQGIAGRLDGHDVRVGTRAHVEDPGRPAPVDLLAAAEAMTADGLSPAFVGIDGEVQGVAGLGDRLRDDARDTVAALRARGVHVRVLSGDHPEIVRRVAREVGVPEADAIGSLTPEQKRDIVAALVDARAAAPRRAVVMVGDGVNDSAALALADVGIAVHGGTGATIVAADIVLTRDGVAPVVELLDGARRLRGVVRRNLAFSLAYNAAAAALAASGFIGPLAAAILMPCSSLAVVLSSAMTRTFSVGRVPRSAGRRDAAGSRQPESGSRP